MNKNSVSILNKCTVLAMYVWPLVVMLFWILWQLFWILWQLWENLTKPTRLDISVHSADLRHSNDPGLVHTNYKMYDVGFN